MSKISDLYMAETTFHVRYAETDAMRIVHHSSYIVYFEEGRSEYIRRRGSSYASFEQQGFFLAVTEINARYIKPAHYDQQITVRCGLADVKSRSLTFQYEIVDAETGDIFVTGTSKHICINAEGQVIKIPNEWRQWSSK